MTPAALCGCLRRASESPPLDIELMIYRPFTLGGFDQVVNHARPARRGRPAAGPADRDSDDDCHARGPIPCPAARDGIDQLVKSLQCRAGRFTGSCTASGGPRTAAGCSCQCSGLSGSGYNHVTKVSSKQPFSESHMVAAYRTKTSPGLAGTVYSLLDAASYGQRR